MRFDRRRGGRGGGRFRDRRPRYDLPKPVKVGEEYDVEIKEVGSRGDGIARIKNFVIFVTGAKMNDKIKVKITGLTVVIKQWLGFSKTNQKYVMLSTHALIVQKMLQYKLIEQCQSGSTALNVIKKS